MTRWMSSENQAGRQKPALGDMEIFMTYTWINVVIPHVGCLDDK
jgi:hypothetical protein